jgi:hypothetical protein
MAFDSARGRMVVFSGFDYSMCQDTWEWDGKRWAEVYTAGNNPPPQWNSAMAYDSWRGRVVYMSAPTDGSGLQEVWEFDGNRWERITPEGERPLCQVGVNIAFDSRRSRMVVFGGPEYRDTWEWDGTSWFNVTPAGDLPPSRRSPAMAYDSARGRVVMYGGFRHSPYVEYQDTWEWDGAEWFDVTPAGDSPTAHTSQAMAYDSIRQRMVLYGGAGDRAETWEWDGNAGVWTLVTVDRDSPPRRFGHEMVYDNIRGKVVLYGADPSFELRDIWERDSITGEWVDVTPSADTPVEMINHAMVYDAAQSEVVLFGGYDYNDFHQETWVWDGIRWKDVTPAGDKPYQRYGHRMEYDSSRGKVVLFGGATYMNDVYVAFTDTWEWDGLTRTWTEVTPAGTSPPVGGYDMAYDRGRQKMVIFGYTGDMVTWEWDGVAGNWQEVTPATGNPPLRSGHGIEYDQARSRVVMFGGEEFGTMVQLQDTWEWDGASRCWTEITPLGELPPGRSSVTFAYDSSQERLVMFGGYDRTFPPFQDLWEFDGLNREWVEVTPEGLNPPHRNSHAMAYDAARRQMVLFGGILFAWPLPDTWLLEADPERRPSFQFHVDLANAGIEPAWCEQVHIRAHAGGVFFPPGSQDTGATLYGWMTGGPGVEKGEWTQLGSNTVGLNATQPYLPSPNQALIDVTSTPEQTPRLILERDRKLVFQVRPSGSSGSESRQNEAAVALDYIEARIRYTARE